MTEIKQIVQQGVTVDRVIDLCENNLRKLDDDWIIAGIELGIFGNVVIFGVADVYNSDDPDHRWRYEGYQDHRGVPHTVWLSSQLPGEMFGYQSSLSDLIKRQEFQKL